MRRCGRSRGHGLPARSARTVSRARAPHGTAAGRYRLAGRNRNATAVLKELGLALFFVQVGFDTGQSFVESLDYQAIYYAFYAILFAVVPMAGSFLFGHYVLKISVSECFGVLCGGMTFTPGLNVIAQVDNSERPIVAYSSVYPVALILVIAVVQVMHLAIVSLQGL
ncbi:MAG: hypothetical protein LC637_10735 [Xanthomonadaceae bacterium]|nr:hypothetical protein [Xanthomonadaceae bacterium]